MLVLYNHVPLFLFLVLFLQPYLFDSENTSIHLMSGFQLNNLKEALQVLQMFRSFLATINTTNKELNLPGISTSVTSFSRPSESTLDSDALLDNVFEEFESLKICHFRSIMLQHRDWNFIDLCKSFSSSFLTPKYYSNSTFYLFVSPYVVFFDAMDLITSSNLMASLLSNPISPSVVWNLQAGLCGFNLIALNTPAILTLVQHARTEFSFPSAYNASTGESGTIYKYNPFSNLAMPFDIMSTIQIHKFSVESCVSGEYQYLPTADNYVVAAASFAYPDAGELVVTNDDSKCTFILLPPGGMSIDLLPAYSTVITTLRRDRNYCDWLSETAYLHLRLSSIGFPLKRCNGCPVKNEETSHYKVDCEDDEVKVDNSAITTVTGTDPQYGAPLKRDSEQTSGGQVRSPPISGNPCPSPAPIHFTRTCGLSSSDSTLEHTNDTTPREGVYVYEWGTRFPFPFPHTQGGYDHSVPRNLEARLATLQREHNQKSMNSGAGQLIQQGAFLYDTAMHSLFTNIYERLLASPQRTVVSQSARAFFIPYDITADTPYGSEARADPGCPLADDVEALLSGEPAWKRLQGADHFLVVSSLPSNQISHKRCANFVLKFCKNCRILTIENTFIASRNRLTLFEYMSALSTNSRTRAAHPPDTVDDISVSVARRWLAVPYVSSYHLPRGVTVHWLLCIGSCRPITVSFIGGSGVGNKIRYRPVLKHLCDSVAPECRWIEVIMNDSLRDIDNQRQNVKYDQDENYDVNHDQRRANNDINVHAQNVSQYSTFSGNILEVYRKSVFCLMPGGHTWSRKATVDALVSGCIPVVFHVETLHTLWPLHLDVTTATAISVLYPAKDLEASVLTNGSCSDGSDVDQGCLDIDQANKIPLMSWLISIRNSEETLLKQRLIARLVRRFQFSYPIDDYSSCDNHSDEADGLDTFDIILRHMLNLFSYE